MHKKWTDRVELTKKLATVRSCFFENADQKHWTSSSYDKHKRCRIYEGSVEI